MGNNTDDFMEMIMQMMKNTPIMTNEAVYDDAQLEEPEVVPYYEDNVINMEDYKQKKVNK